MGISAARKMTVSVSKDVNRSAPSALTPSLQPVGVPDNRLPPPTKLQVYYWAQVCGAVSACGTNGMTDGAWPPDLAPEGRDLKLLAEHGLLVRRQQRWRLRRRWYERLCALKAQAVSTPVFERLERPAPDGPTYAELEAYERICRWLDARPKARSRLPFTGLSTLEAEDDGDVSEEPVAELRAMRRLRLVRHTSRCEWALSSRWSEQLNELQKGIAKALRHATSPLPAFAAAAPASLCAGLDTWGLNWVVDASTLPPRLRTELDSYQQQAQEAEREVETCWIYDGAPLRMYQAGVRAKGPAGGTRAGQGVSWSYILVNPSLRLLIRRTPLGGIVATVRLGSECLWRRTPLAALNELDALVRRLWGKDRGTWRVSYAHLAHDVANAPLEAEQLDRYVSRSRRRAIYDAAQAEVERLARELIADAGSGSADAVDGEQLDWDAFPTYDWEAEYDAAEEELLMADPFAEEGYTWDNHSSPGVREARAALDEPVEKRAVAAHRWGRRLSGVAFSPGGPVSFVMYRKDWEARLTGKRHMVPLWKAAGWNGTDPITRHEARLTREPIRELRLAQAESVACSALDDPWEFLARAADVWGSIVGRAAACPTAVEVAWIRRVLPREGEANRSRWDTDPSWRVMQQAPFTPTPLMARRLIRQKQRRHDVQQIDQQVLGLVKTREALLHTDPTDHDLSFACRDLLRALERETRRRGEDFGDAARLRRRERGLSVSLVGKVLAFRPREERGEVEAERVQVNEVEEVLEEAWEGLIEDPLAVVSVGRSAASRGLQSAQDGEIPNGMQGETAIGRMRTMAWLSWRSAELRLRDAFAALEAAEIEGRAWRELDQLAQVFERASSTYGAAKAAYARLESSGEEGANPG